jgi:hypothetical protein
MNSTLTEEQLKLRFGKFTGSSIYRLIPEGKRAMSAEELAEEKRNKGKRKTIDIPFGDGAMTYIYEKVTEYLTGERKEFKPSIEMLRGIELEPEAKRYLEASKGIKIIEKDTESDDSTAWSIDGWVDEFDTGIEVYCPNSDNHLLYLLGNQVDIKKNYPAKYWQMTFYAGKCNRDNWKFISYDPRFKKNENRMVMINFKVDEIDSNYMIEKVRKAIIIRDHLISKLK